MKQKSSSQKYYFIFVQSKFDVMSAFLFFYLVPPQDIGIIEGVAEYPVENLKDPYSRSVIRLKTVTINMTGEYTCAISTFQDEASNSMKMIVYGKFAREFNQKFNSEFSLSS